MKNAFGWTTAALFAFTLAAAPTWAQNVDVNAPGTKVEVKAPGAREANANFHAWRASKLIGANVQNADQKSLGTVNDIVMDDHGRAHYMILAHGGVLGVGQKLFAVPIGSVQFLNNQDNTAYVRFDIKPEILEKADGFTTDKWPDFTSAQVRKDNDEFYTKNGVKVNVDVNR